MFSNQGARKSVDSLSPIPNAGHFGDFPFHGRGSRSPSRPFHPRRDSTASSIHSIGGSLDSSTGTWGDAVLESGQNAISTLLQPPIVRTGLLPHTSAPASTAHKPPTARDIPPVTLTNVPHVDNSEFSQYLTQVGVLYEQLRRVQADEEEASSSHSRRGSKADATIAEDAGHLRPGKRSSASRRASSSSIASISSIEAPGPARRSSSYRKAASQGPPPLSTIPVVYFDEDFHLENPRTFDVVSERSEVVRPAPGSDDRASSIGYASAPRKALATNAILQEKLSWYMDTVEMHLIQSISTASTTFFTALGSLRELHSEAADSVDRIKTLRRELENLDEEIATRGLDIVHQRRRRENIQQLHDAVMQLREVVEGVGVCESLVDSGEVDTALDNIEALEKLIAGEEGASHNGHPGMELKDLRGTTALQGVHNDMSTLRQRIGKTYEERFITLLIRDIQRHVAQVSTQEVLMRWSSASMRARGGHNREPSAFPSYLTSTDGLRSELLVSLTGLHRAKFLTAAATAYRETALREIKNLIRRPLPSSNDDDNESMMSASTMTGGKQRSQQERSSILARNLRALEPRDAEELLVKIYIGVTETLRRLDTQAKVLLDVASSLGDSDPTSGLRSPPFSPTGRRLSTAALEAQEEIHTALDLSNLLGQAVDIAQDKVVRLLKVRSEQSTRLTLEWFLRYFTLNLHFANECEAISGRSGTSLKNLVNGHIKEFVQRHGDAEKQKLAQGMESDQWASQDFSEKDTELLNHILEGSTRDAAIWAEATKVWIPPSDEENDGSAAASATGTQANGDSGDKAAEAQANGASKPKARAAVVDSETFLLPKSAILCMNGMARFIHLIVGIPSLAADVSSSLIAYLQLFNSRCKQLILGAGALMSAGLKNITTRHLAVASQALAFIAAIIPYVREFVRRHCGNNLVSGVMADFDKVRRDFQEHQNIIYNKLVEIMTGRAVVASRKMRTINWDSGSPAAHEYMETLAKETTTLHRNLTRQLPEGTVRMIMMLVFKNYKDTFGSTFKGLEPTTEAGKESMLRDVEYFDSRLKKLDGFEDAGQHLINIVKAKEIRKAPSRPTSLTPSHPPSRGPSRAPSPALAPGSRAGSRAGSRTGSRAGSRAPTPTPTQTLTGRSSAEIIAEVSAAAEATGFGR